MNARYGRDPIIKLYTHISDRYAPFHVKVITGTSGEAIHVLDGLVNHDSAIDILAHHTDGGGVSDHVFAVMYLLGIKFQPRMSSPNDRTLYAFEAKGRYGWDHINLTGDYVWSDSQPYDADGMRPLNSEAEHRAA